MIDLFNYQIKINANFFFFIHVNDSFLKQFCQKIFIDYNHIWFSRIIVWLTF